MGKEEWKTNSFPDIPAAYTKTREDDLSFPSATLLAAKQILR